jgi:hypothetical protein
MSWYYAENNERRGPIEDAAFDALVRQGAVRPDTLVWRDGLESWVPLAQSGHAAGSPPGAATGVSPSTSRTGEDMGVCSESGRILPRSELVEINGRLVSAEYKNIVLQRIREGVGASGEAADPEALALMIEQRGYNLSIGSCIGRSIGLIRNRFWLTVGATFLTMLISQAAGLIPLIGPIIVFGPITAGLYWLMLLLERKEPAAVGDAFVGFQRGFGQYLGYTAVLFGAIFLCLVPALVVFIVASVSGGDNPSAVLLIVAGLLGFAGFLAMMYFWTSWIFGLPLMVDKQIEFWPAMKVSKRIVGLHWWKIFGLVFCTGLIMMAVVLCAALVVGIIVGILSAAEAGPGVVAGVLIVFGAFFVMVFLSVMPLTYAAVAVAYNDIFGHPVSR